MLAPNIKRVGYNPIERLGDHGKVGRVLEDLEGGGIHIEAILKEEADSHPWEAPQPLNPVPYSQYYFPNQLGAAAAAASSSLHHHLMRTKSLPFTTLTSGNHNSELDHRAAFSFPTLFSPSIWK